MMSMARGRALNGLGWPQPSLSTAWETSYPLPYLDKKIYWWIIVSGGRWSGIGLLHLTPPYT
ncbi:uncharacterized protein DS421_18g610600 [Arachis hypogaea]|nr:uncharacterized protein DS421_18g610600 [Arachis hypogaea]